MREIFENVPEELVSKTATYDQKVPITSILDAVEKFGAVVITKDDSYMGIVDQRSISKRGSLRLEDRFASGKFAKKVPVVTSTTSISEAIDYFYHFATKALPYMKGNSVSGVINRDSMLKVVLSMHLLSKSKVSDIMSTPLIAIDSEASVTQAQNALGQHQVNRLAVLSGGKLMGILTHRNIVKYTPELKGSESRRTYPVREKAEVTVGQICSRNPRTIESDATVDDAIRQLVGQNISSLIATRSGKAIGVITVRDIFETIIQGGGKKAREKILISGLGEDGEEFRTEISDSLSKMAERINKFGNVDVSYISLNVKPVKTRGYELKARVGLEKGGTIYTSVSGFTLDRTLKALEDTIYRIIKSEKEVIVTSTREADSTYDREEE